MGQAPQLLVTLGPAALIKFFHGNFRRIRLFHEGQVLSSSQCIRYLTGSKTKSCGQFPKAYPAGKPEFSIGFCFPGFHPVGITRDRELDFKECVMVEQTCRLPGSVTVHKGQPGEFFNEAGNNFKMKRIIFFLCQQALKTL